MPNSIRRPCRCSGRSGLRSPPGRARCGGCSPRSWRVRAALSATLNWMKSEGATEMADPQLSAPAVLRDLMTTRVAATTADMPMAAAATEMVSERVGSAVVMQGAFLAGILTERDILRAAASGVDLSASRVSEWMTPDPQTATPDMLAEEA